MTTASSVTDARCDCQVDGCSFKSHSLLAHIAEEHNLTAQAYNAQFPEAPTISEDLLTAFEGQFNNLRRHSAVNSMSLTADLMGIREQVDSAVSPDVCLPLPKGARFPTKGSAKKWNLRVLRALVRGRHLFVWGEPGTGKDHIVHVYSAMTRRPVVHVTFRPGTDLAPWFYTRSIDQDGTGWEYGHMWKAITEGIAGRDGVHRPVVVLLSDVDRADTAQVEWFRILTDSISGRILDPHGKMVPLFPGTQFVCTANSCGTGDARGRMVSSNPMDASILDRLGRKIQSSYLHWDDESAILKAKYPEVAERAPWIFSSPEKAKGQLGDATEALRKAILAEELYAEFTHRGLCEVLDEATDILFFRGAKDPPADLLKKAFNAWLDGLDPESQFTARRLVDPHLKGGGGLVEEDDD